MPEFNRIAMIARWRPVHLGQAAVLRGLCAASREVVIGIGSSNRYNLRNPFTPEETVEMLQRVLAEQGGVTILPVPDLDDGPRWRLMVMGMLGTLDAFVTDNPYVASLLKDDYRILRPVAFVPENERSPVDGTLVRRAMAQGEGWQQLVPPEVAEYITANRIDERFRREFGLETLAQVTISS